jgi:hypothetical protein
MLVFVAMFFIAGCGAAARESGFYEHETMYGSMDHLKFSTCGFKNATKKDAQESKTEHWWGYEIDVTGK